MSCPLWGGSSEVRIFRWLTRDEYEKLEIFYWICAPPRFLLDFQSVCSRSGDLPKFWWAFYWIFAKIPHCLCFFAFSENFWVSFIIFLNFMIFWIKKNRKNSLKISTIFFQKFANFTIDFLNFIRTTQNFSISQNLKSFPSKFPLNRPKIFII